MKSAFVTAVTALRVAGVLGDGVGFIGYGKTLYNPTCAFACRNVVKNCELACTPKDSTENHGTAHNPVSTPPDCFVSDPAFLQTMALCIDTYCPLSNNPSLDLIEEYWASHLGTGTLGDYQWVPAVSYHDALAAARADERRAFESLTDDEGEDTESHGKEDHSSHASSKKLRARQFMTAGGPDVTSPLPIIKAGEPLNATSFIAPADWQKQYNGMYDFEYNENGHSTYTIVILIVAVFLPIPLSLLRFVPGVARSRFWTWFYSTLVNPPVYGKHHREPTKGQVGLVPTRGQAMYIFLISLLNIVFLLAPYVHHHPQSTFGSVAEQETSIIGNRAGVMAMGNTGALFLFAARNNALIWITDWSYGTYLLLHRWLGYWAVFHTVLHSIMLLAYYSTYGDYSAELARDYWVWGIVGTVAVVALFVFSILILRQKLYEIFLLSHVALALLFILGYYYHIWYCYEYDWGYEIWAFLAAGIWAADRLLRLVRIAWRGYRSATVSLVPDCDGEYLRIDIHNLELSEGVAYLSFPTLSWRVWESHPFSVAFNSSEVQHHQHEGLAAAEAANDSASTTSATSPNDSAKDEKKDETTITQTPANPTTPRTPPQPPSGTTPTTTFFARVRTGMTKSLATKCSSSPGPHQVRIGVLVDGPYPHSGDVRAGLRHCPSLVCVAGGVGITAVLPYLLGQRRRRQSSAAAAAAAAAAANMNNNSNADADADADANANANTNRPAQPRLRLHWATRKAGLASALAPALAALRSSAAAGGSVGGGVEIETVVGQRLDLDGILRAALVKEGDGSGGENEAENDGGGGKGEEEEEGPVGIVVCGPPGMADHVRHRVVQLSRNGGAGPTRPYVLVDEAFGW